MGLLKKLFGPLPEPEQNPKPNAPTVDIKKEVSITEKTIIKISEADESFMDGITSIYRKQINIYEFENAAKLDPKYAAPEVYSYIKGVISRQLQKYNEAIPEYQNVVNVNQNDFKAWYGLGYCYQILKKNEDALQAYSKVNEINPYCFRAWYNKGIVLDRLDKMDDAIESFYNASLTDYNTIPMYLEKIPSKYPAKCREIRKKYDGLSKTMENNSEFFFEKGNKLAIIAKLQNIYQISELRPPSSIAIQSYIKSLEIDKNNAKAWYNLGVFGGAINYIKGKNAECYINALELKPDFIKALYNLGSIQLWSYFPDDALLARRDYGDLNKAINYFDEAIKIDAMKARIWTNRGIAFYLMEDYSEAYRSFDKALSLDQYDIKAWFFKGNSYFNQERYEEALNAYDKTTWLKPWHALAWYKKYKIHLKLKTKLSQKMYYIASACGGYSVFTNYPAWAQNVRELCKYDNYPHDGYFIEM